MQAASTRHLTARPSSEPEAMHIMRTRCAATYNTYPHAPFFPQMTLDAAHPSRSSGIHIRTTLHASTADHMTAPSSQSQAHNITRGQRHVHDE